MHNAIGHRDVAADNLGDECAVGDERSGRIDDIGDCLSSGRCPRVPGIELWRVPNVSRDHLQEV